MINFHMYAKYGRDLVALVYGDLMTSDIHAGLILGLHPANERRRYFVTTSLIGWVQT